MCCMDRESGSLRATLESMVKGKMSTYAWFSSSDSSSLLPRFLPTDFFAGPLADVSFFLEGSGDGERESSLLMSIASSPLSSETSPPARASNSSSISDMIACVSGPVGL